MTNARQNRGQAWLARILLKKNLGWLPGYPVGSKSEAVVWKSTHWRDTGEAQVWELGREELRRAQMTITKLRHHFPKALPKIADDPDDWLLRMDVVLRLLKASVHEGQDLTAESILTTDAIPRRWMQQVIAERNVHPELNALLDAVCFSEFTGRKNISLEVIEWIVSHAVDLNRLQSVPAGEDALSLQLTLCELRGTMPETLFRTFTCAVSDPRISQWKIEASLGRITWLREALFKLINGVEPKPEPQAFASEQSVGELLSMLVRATANEKPKQQRHVFELLSLLLDEPTLADVQTFQTEVDAEDRRLTRTLRQLESGSLKRPRFPHERQELNNKVLPDPNPLPGPGEISRSGTKVLPMAHRMKFLSYCLSHFQELEKVKLKQWTNFLTVIPSNEHALRVGVLRCWLRYVLRDPEIERTFYHTLGRLEFLFRQRGIAQCLKDEWNRSFLGGQRDWVVGLCQMRLENLGVTDRAIGLLERVAYDHGAALQGDLLESLVEFALAEEDLDRAARVITTLSTQPDSYYDESDLRSAFRFGGEDDDTVVTLLRLFDVTNHHQIMDFVEALRPVAEDPFLRRAIVRLALDEDVKQLGKLGAIARLFPSLAVDVPRPIRFETGAEWIHDYPAALHSDLQDLAQVAPEAERIANRILRQEFPSTDALQQQIATISRKLSQTASNDDAQEREHLRQRLSKLTDRMNSPTEVSEGRLRTLGRKLRARIEHEVVEGYTSTMREHLAVVLRDRYELPKLPEELLCSPLDGVLVNLLKLTEPMRKLGLRLVFETLNRSTHRFDDEPANVRFAQDMDSQGVRMQPWLDESFQTVFKSDSGITYRLAFTRDVIDFLLMGFHFGTCLSPGDTNFFSTVANAVDINKRVVYGKTDSGRIIGRCLFALNDNGQVLTFHRYSHDSEDGFSAAVDGFAEQLVNAMNTTQSSSGNVRRLVAKAWYDDGAQSIAGGAEINTTVREVLETSPAEDVFSNLRETMSAVEVRESLEPILKLPEFRKRPDAVRRLMQDVAGSQDFSTRELLTTARIAFEVGVTSVSHQLLHKASWKDVVAVLKADQCDCCNTFHSGLGSYAQIFEMITDYHPSLALRAIRGSRSGRCKDDLREENKQRRYALSVAHRKLGRLQLADSLLPK